MSSRVMNKFSRSQKLNPQAYICWQCRARSIFDTTPRPRRKLLDQNGPKIFRRPFTIRYTSVGEKLRPEFPIDLLVPSEPTINPVFRQKLRQWEAGNAEPAALAKPTLLDGQPPGTINIDSRTGQAQEFNLAPSEDDVNPRVGAVLVDREGILDVGDDRTFLVPGDMVAIKSMSGEHELAIYIRDLDTQSQFYSMTGRYVHTRSRASDFLVPGYFDEKELSSVLPLLPTSDLPRALEDKLHVMGEHVPRHVGRPLIKKMLAFWREARDIYQKHASRLDSAHNTIAHLHKFQYGTLSEFADRILSSHVQRNVDGTIPGPALLAVHQALVKEDSGIRVQSGGALRSAIIYEVSSIQDQQINRTVALEVQKYRQDIQHGTNKSVLPSAVKKYQHLIDQSRTTRESTKHAMIGPSAKTSTDINFRSGVVVDELKGGAHTISRFLENWTAMGTISKSSPLNGIAATILRAIDRYPDETLDQRTGWKFLQEIGLIPPWQTLQAYTLRLPLTAPSLFTDPLEVISPPPVPDLSQIHKKLEARVYCIDDVTAKEIDDGVSLRRTDKADEFWLGIHIADPASYVVPRKRIANLAEAQVGNTYLQDRFTSMLPTSLVEESLTLATDRPCLTFSALMNTKGDILDSNVSANKINQVTYITPSTFATIGDDHPQITHNTYTVGNQAGHELTPSRIISEKEDLSPESEEDLRILHQLSRARDVKMKEKGLIHFNQPQPHVSASFGGEEWKARSPKHARRYYGDPSIRVTVPTETNPQRFNELEKTSAVARLMLTANEVAAKWCYERNIPIPYRKTDASHDKDPRAYYDKHIRPLVESGGKVSERDLMTFYNQIGRARLSTTPGPHSALGVDLIAKVTSPLRRYPDLLAHWQIRAALLREFTTGKSLVGSKEKALGFLPFTRAQIEEKIPYIDLREREIARAHRQATRAWLCQFLVRAWKFGQAELPKRMNWRCADLRPSKDEAGMPAILGTLTDFACLTKMVLGEGMQESDVVPGDEYEVELVNVDVYNLNIFVKPVRKWIENP